MILYILLAALIVAFIITLVVKLVDHRGYKGYYFEWTALWGVPLIGVIIIGVYIGITASFVGATAWTTDWKIDHNSTQKLAALSNGQSVQGGGNLFYVEIDTDDDINYVYQSSDSGLHLDSQDADNSTIYQNAESASDSKMVDHHWSAANPVLLPWRFDGGDTYDFHVPQGTVKNEYSVDVNK